MTSLLEKNLVRQVDGSDDEPRFTMLETIREFALEQLVAHDEEDRVGRRHASWCLISRPAPNLRSGDQDKPSGWRGCNASTTTCVPRCDV